MKMHNQLSPPYSCLGTFILALASLFQGNAVADLYIERSDLLFSPRPATNHVVKTIDVSTMTDDSFDGLMRTNANANTVVWIGKGLFRTRGAWGLSYPQSFSPGYRLQTGCQVHG